MRFFWLAALLLLATPAIATEGGASSWSQYPYTAADTWRGSMNDLTWDEMDGKAYQLDFADTAYTAVAAFDLDEELFDDDCADIWYLTRRAGVPYYIDGDGDFFVYNTGLGEWPSTACASYPGTAAGCDTTESPLQFAARQYVWDRLGECYELVGCSSYGRRSRRDFPNDFDNDDIRYLSQYDAGSKFWVITLDDEVWFWQNATDKWQLRDDSPAWGGSTPAYVYGRDYVCSLYGDAYRMNDDGDVTRDAGMDWPVDENWNKPLSGGATVLRVGRATQTTGVDAGGSNYYWVQLDDGVAWYFDGKDWQEGPVEP